MFLWGLFIPTKRINGEFIKGGIVEISLNIGIPGRITVVLFFAEGQKMDNFIMDCFGIRHQLVSFIN